MGEKWYSGAKNVTTASSSYAFAPHYRSDHPESSLVEKKLSI